MQLFSSLKFIKLLLVGVRLSSAQVGVNFTLFGNHLMHTVFEDARLTDRIEDVFSHGCWCSFLRVSETSIKPKRGHPIDPVDQICRSYSQCYRCVTIEGYCDTVSPLYIYVKKRRQPFTCNFPQPSFCARERCECDLNAAVALQTYLSENPDWNPRNPNTVDECQLNTSGRIPKNHCCKIQGMWKQYSNITHTCDYENEVILEGQIDLTARKAIVKQVSEFKPDLDYVDVESQIQPNVVEVES